MNVFEVSKNLRMRFIDIKMIYGSRKGWLKKMRGIVTEDDCNDTYGRCRMCQALKLKYPDERIHSKRTV